MPEAFCLNCNEILYSTQNFCANCGQKSQTHRLTLHEIIHEAFHAITHADKGFLYLVKELTIKPGVVAKEYIEGKRKKYFNPFSFLVIVTGILVLITSNFHIFGSSAQMPTVKTTDHSPMAVTKMGYIKRSAQFTNFVNNHSNVVLFISTPFLAFFLWLFYRQRKLLYAEHLTSMVFFNSFLMITTSIIFAPLIYFTRHQNMYGLWAFIMISFHTLYVGFAYKQLLNLNGVGGFFKAFVISALASLCWVLFSGLIGTSYIFFG